MIITTGSEIQSNPKNSIDSFCNKKENKGANSEKFHILRLLKYIFVSKQILWFWHVFFLFYHHLSKKNYT